MKKIAIITDSNSGITLEEAKALGISILPMPFILEGRPYFEGIDISPEFFFEKLIAGADISTSMPNPTYVEELWDGLLETHDEIVHIPTSCALSAACESALGLARGYGNRVHVVDNQRISVSLRQSALDAKILAETGKDAAQIKAYLEEEKSFSSIYLMVDTLKHLKKGGRITPAAAAIGTVLNIKPVLQIQGGKLDAYAKVRGVKQARAVMIEAIKRDMGTRFATFAQAGQMRLMIAYSTNKTVAEEYKKEVNAAFPGYDITIHPLSLNISCHVGPGAVGVVCVKTLEGAG